MTNHPNRNRKKLPQARVWQAGGIGGGYYYRFGHDTPVGPFDTMLEAGEAARKVIIALAEAAEPTVNRS